MNTVAALPMYDWPEAHDAVDEHWAGLYARLDAAGIGAPRRLARCNRDLPSVPGGILDRAGKTIAPDPVTLDPDGLDLHTLWRHPDLLVAQTCWGPMEMGLAQHVVVIGQPGYDDVEGGDGAHYSSVILAQGQGAGIKAPSDGKALLPLDLLRGRRLAFNETGSMSGFIALARDLGSVGESMEIFSGRVQSGSHRGSMISVAEGKADVCAVDCRSWQLAQRFEPLSSKLKAVGWTARRLGLPYITSRKTPDEIVDRLRQVLSR